MLVARAALHFWEEPPISGERGSGAVFFAHCPLQCVYCQNRDLAEGRAGERVTIGRLAEICIELEAQGALNVNFVTPTHYSLQIRDAVAEARRLGFSQPIVWNTSGYERTETIEALAGTADVFLADFKYADAVLADRYSQAPDYPEVALAAIRKMAEVCGPPRYDEVDGQLRMTGGVIVRHLILPGAPGNSEHALELLWNELGKRVRYSIMNQYTPLGTPAFPELSSPVSGHVYERILDFADDLGMQDYFWQDGPAVGESFIPAWDGTGV